MPPFTFHRLAGASLYGAAPGVPLQAAWVRPTHATNGGPLYVANISKAP